ncbi:MAG TPA: amidohydrolase family protein [Pyrinomonadaceae bacterium]|nr:amidohydrolase family protein [Pyrinomonadaceae bacterium]
MFDNVRSKTVTISGKSTMIIDFHNHYYPPAYLEALRTGPSNVRVTFDDDGNPLLHYPGDYNIVVPGHRDIEFREQVLEENGIAKQILTLTTPGTHIETPQRAVTLAQMVNDCFAEVVATRGRRFGALATLPLNDPPASVVELERAITQLHFRGAMIFSNINGVGLDDPSFWPVWEKADELGAVIFIHPTHPANVEAMSDYWLTALVGFLLDTTLAAGKLVFSGVFRRFPRITWVLGHLGGTVPYVAERWDRGYRAFKECRANIDRPPSEYLKQLYYDSVNFDGNALQNAIAFAGVDHILAGSDYPHQIGSLELMKESIAALPISEADKNQIRAGNTTRILGL